MTITAKFPINGNGIKPTTRYTVFIDESFKEFLTLSNPSGYFCYVALMVPTSKLNDLARFWSALRARIVSAYKAATNHDLGNGEVKSGYLNQLSFNVRQMIASRIGNFLRKNQCWVGGLYVTVDGLALYNLRHKIAREDDARELPPDWAERLPAVKQGLLEVDAGPGKAELLLWLLHATLEIPLHWLGSLGGCFEVIYDPRERKEDNFLLKHTGSWLSDEGSSMTRFPGVFLGATAKLASSHSPGLMLTDLILRDLRFLFADLPELRSELSTTQLVLPQSQADEPLLISIHGNLFKNGIIRRMSPALRQKLMVPTANSMLSLYADRFASHKVSCYAEFGEARLIDFRAAAFLDMVD